MTDNNSASTRSSTLDTLVGPPNAIPSKSWWSKSRWAAKQCSISSERDPQMTHLENEASQYAISDGPKRPKEDAHRRSSTENTLVDIPEGALLHEGPFLDNNNSTLVTSPTSTSAPSSLFSPTTPGSALPTLSPIISTSSLSSISEPQRRGWSLPKKSDKPDGQTFESMRSTALLVARTTMNIAEASDIPYLKGIAGLALLIFEYADGVAANREQCSRIINSVARLLMALEAKMTKQNCRVIEALELQADQLKTSLEKVLRDVKRLSDRRRNYLTKFIQMEKDKEIIKRCDDELKFALDVFSLQSSIETQACLTYLGRAFDDLEQRMNRIGSSFKLQDEELQGSPSIETRQRQIQDKILPCLANLPPPPTIFCGRADVLRELIDRVVRPTAAHIAILGPGGIGEIVVLGKQGPFTQTGFTGKSSLVLKLLHHDDVLKHYKNRFFVPCDSAVSAENLVSVIASHIGLPHQQSGDRETEILALFYAISSESDSADGSCRPIIIVLDNFENPWERNRTDVERFLTRLAAVENLTLIITLRGAELPSHVNWDQPLLPPLQTLKPQAARETFLSISGAKYPSTFNGLVRDELDELLTLCGRLPLAIRLMAELAVPGIDTVPGLVKRWKRATRSTSMLSDGDDPGHSLEVSIELSLDSPRVKRVPEARTLLGLLAMLPDGILEDDLELAVPHLESLETCRRTLLKTSLAYSETASGRLKVLAPIRAYVASYDKYQPWASLIRAFEDYFWAFIKHTRMGQNDEEQIKRALPELGNIESLIDRAFSKEFEPHSAVASAVNLGLFFLQASLGKPCLAQLQRVLAISRQIQNKKLEADCTYTIALTNHRFFVVRGDATSCGDDFLKALALYEETDDKAGQGHCYHQLGSFYHYVRQLEHSKNNFEKAVQMHLQADCLNGQASALLCLARVLHIMSEVELAVKRAHESLQLLRKKYHDPVLEAQCLQFLGYVQYNNLCNHVAAAELFEESTRIYKALLLEETSNCMDTSVSAGELAYICSRYDDAMNAFQRAATVYHKTNRRDREAYALVNLGRAHLGLGAHSEALTSIRAGLVIWEELPNTWGIGISHIALGDVAVHEGLFSEAEEHYTKALQCFRADSNHWKTFEAECFLKIGILFIHMERESAARENIESALQLYNETASRRGRTNCLRRLAELDLKGAEKRDALNRLEAIGNEYSAMGLHVESQACVSIIAKTYRLLRERQPKMNLQLQIKK